MSRRRSECCPDGGGEDVKPGTGWGSMPRLAAVVETGTERLGSVNSRKPVCDGSDRADPHIRRTCADAVLNSTEATQDFVFSIGSLPKLQRDRVEKERLRDYRHNQKAEGRENGRSTPVEKSP
ncbi:hypothetical protein NDU88_002570 [Pleurodeles waltl]|uniref:Uncharacterized protein n=1 Tax=Pleurodeles waltl TaxID=8319 RepID=A0AAV7MNS9_PLEWA|nr:hypothetical protein NDU88_002570 [Pleurodeles waltl]